MARLETYRWENADHGIECTLPDTDPEQVLTTETALPNADVSTPTVTFFKSTYTVQAGDELLGLAEILELEAERIKEWNGKKDDTLHPGEELILYFPTSVLTD